jgi:parallel beta-helix repeat protein
MKTIFLFSVGLLFMLGLFFPTYSTQAATGVIYYVDNTNPTCSNSGTGTIPSQPLCSINVGAGKALPGDIVRVLAGTYAEKVKPQNNGTAGNPITFSAAPGVTVTGDGSASGSAFRLYLFSYITIDGFNVTHTSEEGIYVSTSDHIIISNNHVSYAGTANVSGLERCGIYLSTTTYSTVTGNLTDHNSLDGIRVINSSSNNTVSNNISYANASVYGRYAEGINLYSNSTSNAIIHNLVYANEDSGLNFYTSSGSNLIIGNVSYGNGDHGIDNNDSSYNIIVGNTIQGNVTSGINLEGNGAPPGSSGATVENNILVDNGYGKLVGGGTLPPEFQGNIRVDKFSTIGTILNYNLYFLTTGGTQINWAGTPWTSISEFSLLLGLETNGLLGDPLFTFAAPIAVRPAAGPPNMPLNAYNYYIMEGSPAIDSANSAAPNEPDFDILGRPRMDDPSIVNTGSGIRTYDDRGAYEFFPNQHQLMLPLIVR